MTATLPNDTAFKLQYTWLRLPGTWAPAAGT